ncbi:MAG: hypothetical protein LBQ57_00770 [Spirochaetales bacterium]|jgi:hypothetical protein|nr:hypothetical protein [Spirochaetales bacterium]
MRFWKILLLSIAGGAADYAMSLVTSGFGVGLYLDTIFTVTVTFSGGPGAGLISALLYTAACRYDSWGIYLFGICSVAAVVLTYLFSRIFPAECGSLRIIGRPAEKKEREDLPPTILNIITVLVLFSLTMCVLMSVLGGIIAWFIQAVLNAPLVDVPPETFFKLGLVRHNISLIVTEILARFPVNILDRIITVFTAYGMARLLVLISRHKQKIR